jgi:cell division protein FtsN
MARRNGNKKQARRSGGGTPGWMYAVGGLVVGVALAAGWYLHRGGKVDDLLPRPNPEARAPAQPEEPVAQDAPAPEPRKSKYEFYDVLRENEAVFPDAELNAQAAAEAEAAQAGVVPPEGTDATPADPADPTAATPDAVPAGPRYLIQAGAFRSLADADAVKARIALTGEIARVESAQNDGGTIYRVRLGPYPNAQALAAAKQALANHGIDAVAIRAQ